MCSLSLRSFGTARENTFGQEKDLPKNKAVCPSNQLWYHILFSQIQKLFEMVCLHCGWPVCFVYRCKTNGKLPSYIFLVLRWRQLFEWSLSLGFFFLIEAVNLVDVMEICKWFGMCMHETEITQERKTVCEVLLICCIT